MKMFGELHLLDKQINMRVMIVILAFIFMVFIISVQRIVLHGGCLCSFITEVIHNESPFTTVQ